MLSCLPHLGLPRTVWISDTITLCKQPWRKVFGRAQDNASISEYQCEPRRCVRYWLLVVSYYNWAIIQQFSQNNYYNSLWRMLSCSCIVIGLCEVYLSQMSIKRGSDFLPYHIVEELLFNSIWKPQQYTFLEIWELYWYSTSHEF